MSGIGTGYDLSVSTYSPNGKVFQTDYAQKAVDNSGTAVGLVCSDGVVVGVEKAIVSKMLVKGSNRRTFAVDRHAGLATVGLPADGRQVVNKTIEECATYKRTYGTSIPGQVLADRLASYIHLYNLYWYARPFGTAVLLAVRDPAKGPQLYLVEPSGATQRYFGTAVGKGRQSAKTELERINGGVTPCRQGVVEVAKMIHSVRDEEKPFELELAWLCEESGWDFRPVPAAVAEEAEAAAKAAKEQADM